MNPVDRYHNFGEKTIRLCITGKVQGVFYRSNAKTQAERLGVAGWVRNEWDGSVIIVARGRQKQLEEFERWCRQGPPAAFVENVIVKDEKDHRIDRNTFEVL